MGSIFSKAVRPHVTAGASSVATAQHHRESNHANENVDRQDPAPQLPDRLGSDDINVAASTSTADTLRRRHSEPARPTVGAINVAMERSFPMESSLLHLYSPRRRWDTDHADTDRRPPLPAVPLTPPPPPEPEVQCLICCKTLPREKEPGHTKEVIRPCKSCDSTYCTSCVKNMFIESCKDLTRMPPRCCVQISLHHGRPYLSQEEVTVFKSKYEEWLTPNPFYCPVPTCSVFIPERLLLQHGKSKGKRVDSGIGTPTANTLACPTCEASICANCRQSAHPNSLCNVAEFGIDAETAALLKSWGYKKCPKCGHGLKRMFGCNHMECRCGANFCWVCLKSSDDPSCNGECYDGGEGEDSDSDAEYDEQASQPTTPENIEPTPAEAIAIDATTQPSTTGTSQTTTQPQPIPRLRNLDGGSHRYWEEQDLDFGAEPTGNFHDRSWTCQHDFQPYKIPLAKALVNAPSSPEMECVKCWRAVHPDIDAHKSPPEAHETTVSASAGARGRGGRRGQLRGRGRGRGRYMPPRGLFRADATIGTAPHLTAPISPLSQSVPARQASPMEDIQYSRAVVTHGNSITTAEPDPPRRASLETALDAIINQGEASGKKPFAFTFAAPSVLAAAPLKTSLAHECQYCDLFVCESCMEAVMASQYPDGEADEIDPSQPSQSLLG